MRPENSPSLSQTSAESPTPKPRLSSARVAPNPSQTTPSNPRNFFQASDPGASLGADIPFVRLCSSEGVGRSQRCPEVGERDQSVSTGFFFAPLPAFLTARTGSLLLRLCSRFSSSSRPSSHFCLSASTLPQRTRNAPFLSSQSLFPLGDWRLRLSGACG